MRRTLIVVGLLSVALAGCELPRRADCNPWLEWCLPLDQNAVAMEKLKAQMAQDEADCRAGKSQQACLLYQADVQRWTAYQNAASASRAAQTANGAAMLQYGATMMNRAAAPPAAPLGSFGNPATCHTTPISQGYTQIQCQ